MAGPEGAAWKISCGAGEPRVVRLDPATFAPQSGLHPSEQGEQLLGHEHVGHFHG